MALDRRSLDWPFFGAEHRSLSDTLMAWAPSALSAVDHHDVDAACRRLVRELGAAGFLRYCVPATFGGALPALDSRALCVIRETLAYHDGLADFAFAMQGLGSGAITLDGSPELQQRILPRVASGEWIAAFALSEPDAGSDVAALTCEARVDGTHYVLSGEKTWISNGGIADVYCVFARTGEAPGTRGISAFVVFADTDRGAGTAPLGTASLRGMPGAPGAAPRAAGRGVQAGDADPGHLPGVGRGRGSWVRAARPR
jgi:acyl-CoA dehydrogenase